MDQCVHPALARAHQVVLAQVVLVVLVPVAKVADQAVQVVLVPVVQVAVSVAQVAVVQAVAQVVPAVLAVDVLVQVDAAMASVAHQRKNHVRVVVKTSTRCCHRQPLRTHRATRQFQKA